MSDVSVISDIIVMNANNYDDVSDDGDDGDGDGDGDGVISIYHDLCRCNKKNTKLDELLLFFCYLFHTCSICYIHYDNSDVEDYEYEYGYIDTFYIYKEQEYKEIQKIIKKNHNNIVFTKNVIGVYPLNFVILLQDILDKYYKEEYTKQKDKKLIEESQLYLEQIKEHIIAQYVKRDAFEYITQSSLIGNQFAKKQLPYDLWEHIFTFI